MINKGISKPGLMKQTKQQESAAKIKEHREQWELSRVMKALLSLPDTLSDLADCLNLRLDDEDNCYVSVSGAAVEAATYINEIYKVVEDAKRVRKENT